MGYKAQSTLSKHWRTPSSVEIHFMYTTLSVLGVGQLGRMAEGRGAQGRSKILGVVFLWGNGNELQGLRPKFWRGPSYHAIGCFQGHQHVMLSSIVRLRAFPWYKTVLPPSCGSTLCIIAEKALKMPNFSKTGSRNMAETCAIDFSYPTSYSTSIQLGGLSAPLLPVLMEAGHGLRILIALHAPISAMLLCM